MRKTRTGWLAAIVLALGLVAAGCDDDNVDPGPVPPVTPDPVDPEPGPGDCGQDEEWDATSQTCKVVIIEDSAEAFSLRTDGVNCPVEGDLEGQFTDEDMDYYLVCVLPGIVEWINVTYPGDPRVHPNNYMYVPVGATGANGCVDGYDDWALLYCPADGNVYLGQLAVWEQYSEHGDAAPVVIIAHEVTHRIQDLAGMPEATTHNEQIRYENQADCGAGVFMDYAYDKGWMDMEDDIVDLAGSLMLAGQLDGPERSHGTMQERLDSFDLGWLSQQSMYACNIFVPEVPLIVPLQ